MISDCKTVTITRKKISEFELIDDESITVEEASNIYLGGYIIDPDGNYNVKVSLKNISTLAILVDDKLQQIKTDLFTPIKDITVDVESLTTDSILLEYLKIFGKDLFIYRTEQS